MSMHHSIHGFKNDITRVVKLLRRGRVLVHGRKPERGVVVLEWETRRITTLGSWRD